jgi:UDP-N-acetylmuramyl pentapeptide phosphotransferase/UDP-N-acetylglucosamine-1-phosphate transferase
MIWSAYYLSPCCAGEIKGKMIPWGIFIIVAEINAVNLTDGLDGVAGSMLMFSFSFIALSAAFKMAPLHHHFELVGWSETAIVWAAIGITLIGCSIAITLLLI